MGGVDPAVPTLLGVLLGGGMASGTSFYLERMRAVRDATAAAKRERGDARGAARLLAGELEYGRGLINRAREKGYYTWSRQSASSGRGMDGIPSRFRACRLER
jgi:hypothetical protein